MKLKSTPVILKSSKSFIIIMFIAIAIAFVSSCGRNKTEDTTLSRISPPPPPPSLPKPLTMIGSDTIWRINELPLISGGRELLVNYISKNINYPEEAKAKGTEGKVIVKFFISSKGNVSGHEIVQSVSPDLDAEA